MTEAATVSDHKSELSGEDWTEKKAALGFDYYKIRLEHTIQHTQQSNRTIYLVNGAVLAGIYYTLGVKVVWIDAKVMSACLLMLLALVNLIHAGIIISQGWWYRILDIGLAETGGVHPRPQVHLWLGLGTHRLYALLHGLLASALLGFGLFLLS